MSTSLIVKPNTFYKEQFLTKDVSLRAFYGDTYDGKSISGDISTDTNQKFYIAESVAPPMPIFAEEPVINSLYCKYYPNTVSSSNALSNPRLKLYKVQDNLPLTEGDLNVIDENIASFCSYVDWEGGWLTDNFSGINTGFSDRADYEKVSATAIKGTDRSYLMSGKDYNDWLNHNGFNSFGHRIWSLGGSRESGVTDAMTVKLMRKTGTDGEMTEKYWLVAVRTNRPGAGQDFVTVGGGHTAPKYAMSISQILDNGGWVNPQGTAKFEEAKYTIYDTEFVDRVTQFNSIFNYVNESEDAEDVKTQTIGTTGDDNKFYTYSRFLLNPSDKLTGENAGQMTNLWENYSGSDASYANYFGTTEAGTPLNQTVMGSIDYFPQPVNLDIGGGPLMHLNKRSVAAKEIEFGLKFEMMPPVSVMGGGATDAGYYNFQRGFFIIMADKVPLKTDTFYSYLNRFAVNATGLSAGSGTAATGLFFFKPRSSETTLTDEGTFIRAVSFLDAATNGTAQVIRRDSTDDDFPYSYWDFNRLLVGTTPPVVNLELPYNEWFTLRFKFNPSNRNVQVYCPDVLNPDGAMVSGNLSTENYPLANGKVINLNCISVWATNYRAVRDSPGADALNPLMGLDDEGFRDDDMQQSVLIDHITFRNYNNKVLNTSVNENNFSPGVLSLKNHLTVPQYSGTDAPPISGNLSVGDNYFGTANTPTPVNLCFGFEELPAVLSGTTGGASLLLNNYTTVALGPEYISDFYVSGSYSNNSGIGLGSQTIIPADTRSSPGGAASWFSIGGGPSSIDRFTQKGFLGVSGTFVDKYKRENIFCAARVIGANGDGTEIIVDNPSVFDLPLGPAASGGTDYVMWMLDNPRTENPLDYAEFVELTVGSGSVGFVSGSLNQVQTRNGSTIYLNRSTTVSDNGGNSMTATNPIGGANVATSLGPAARQPAGGNKSRLGSVFISPKKYWLNLHLVPAQGTSAWGEWYAPAGTGALWKNQAARSYQGSLMVSGMVFNTATGTLGSTFNEYLFTDGFNQKEWNVTNTDQGIFDVETDYGFGVYDAGDDLIAPRMGGYINLSFPENSTYNYIDLSSYVRESNPTYNSEFNFGLYPFFEDSTALTTYTVNVDNREGTNPPSIIWGIEDKVMEINNLAVAPAVDVLELEDPFSESNADFSNVKFTWEESASDVWYRMLIVDTLPVFNKYHGMNFWAPLNEAGGTYSDLDTTTMKYYTTRGDAGSYFTSLGASTIPSNIEGFQGYGFKQNKNSFVLRTATGSSDRLTLGSANEFTFVAHLKPTSVPSSDGIAIQTNSGTNTGLHSLEVKLMTTQKIRVRVNPGTDDVTLNSVSNYPCDGEEPIVVFVTYNSNRAFDNVKLYVNGRLEATADYTEDFLTAENVVCVGSNRAATAFFPGFIEEVVMYDKEYYCVPNPNEYVLDTAHLADQTSGVSNYQQARLFFFDYHNIRGSSPREVAQSKSVAWKVTAL